MKTPETLHAEFLNRTNRFLRRMGVMTTYGDAELRAARQAAFEVTYGVNVRPRS